MRSLGFLSFAALASQGCFNQDFTFKNSETILSASSGSGSSSSTASKELKSLQAVMTKNCYQCHTNYRKLGIDANLTGALVVAGKPELSKLFVALNGSGAADSALTSYSQRMPLDLPALSGADIEVFRAWILSLGTSGVVLPSPSPLPLLPVPNPAFASIAPPSPSRSVTNPKIAGTLDVSSATLSQSEVARVSFYGAFGCSGVELGWGSVDAFLSGGVTVTVPANGVTTLYAQASTSTGRKSDCRPMASYLHDSVAPAAPVLTATVPATTSSAPSSNVNPAVRGSVPPVAPATSTDAVRIQLFKSANCSGSIAAEDDLADFTGNGIVLGVDPIAVTSISARALDASGNVSGCSAAALTYTSNATNLPANPTVTSISPQATAASPTRTTTPTLTGTAPLNGTIASTRVDLYKDDANCTSAAIGSTTTINATTRAWSITVSALSSAPVDKDFRIYAKASTATAASACTQLTESVAAVPVYRLDTIAPTAPALAGLTPLPPFGASATPKVYGSAPSADTATVQVYLASTCSGTANVATPSGQLSTFTTAAQGLTLNLASLAANAQVSVSLQATDRAGNLSACASNVTSFRYNPDANQRRTDALAVIQASCVSCHDPGSRDLRMTTDQAWQSARVTSGSAIVVAGNPQGSALFVRIRGNGIAGSIANMPPTNSDVPTLTERQVNTVRYWIANMAAVTAPSCNPAQESPAYQPISLLSRPQYSNTLSDLTGIPGNYATTLPPDTNSKGYTHIAGTSDFSSTHADSMFTIAETLGAQLGVRTSPGILGTCVPSGTSATAVGNCARPVITAFLPKAYRRPVTADEISQFVGVATALVADGETYETGMQAALTAILISPRFLYRLELDGSTAANEIRALSSVEIASRLSYFIWNSMPDSELLSADLTNATTLSSQVDRMIASTKSASMLPDFADGWLNLVEFDTLAINASTFPTFSSLRSSMRTETQLFLQNAMSTGMQIPDLLDTKDTFVNSSLATHYEVPAGSGTCYGGTSGAACFRKVTLPNSTIRTGLLGQASVLSVTSHPESSSPVRRGAWTLSRVLCTPVGLPPPNVGGLEDVEISPTASARDRLAAHQRNGSSCIGCHSSIDPLGLAFENYDAIGRFRTRDEFQNLIKPEGAFGSISFANSAELIQGIKAGPEFTACVTKNLATYALARLLDPIFNAGDRCTVDQLLPASATVNTFPALIKRITSSDAFRRRKASGDRL